MPATNARPITRCFPPHGVCPHCPLIQVTSKFESERAGHDASFPLLGNERFREQVEVALGRRLSPKQRGRRRTEKTADAHEQMALEI